MGRRGLAQDAGQFALTGGVSIHEVVRGDTLSSLSARLGVGVRALAADNGLADTAVLRAGSRLQIDNRHIVPAAVAAAPLVVNLPQRMAFHRNAAVTAIPVAVGRPQWATPRGSFTIVLREENPTWDVPRSILEEARRRGRSHPARVPPGPANPLGAFWLGLSQGGIGLHGTNVPSSIYSFASHGCIRLHPDDIAWLFSTGARRRSRGNRSMNPCCSPPSARGCSSKSTGMPTGWRPRRWSGYVSWPSHRPERPRGLGQPPGAWSSCGTASRAT